MKCLELILFVFQWMASVDFAINWCPIVGKKVEFRCNMSEVPFVKLMKGVIAFVTWIQIALGVKYWTRVLFVVNPCHSHRNIFCLDSELHIKENRVVCWPEIPNNYIQQMKLELAHSLSQLEYMSISEHHKSLIQMTNTCIDLCIRLYSFQQSSPGVKMLMFDMTWKLLNQILSCLTG